MRAVRFDVLPRRPSAAQLESPCPSAHAHIGATCSTCGRLQIRALRCICLLERHLRTEQVPAKCSKCAHNDLRRASWARSTKRSSIRPANSSAFSSRHLQDAGDLCRRFTRCRTAGAVLRGSRDCREQPWFSVDSSSRLQAFALLAILCVRLRLLCTTCKSMHASKPACETLTGVACQLSRAAHRRADLGS